jgi:hypothetical protein
MSWIIYIDSTACDILFLYPSDRLLYEILAISLEPHVERECEFFFARGAEIFWYALCPLFEFLSFSTTICSDSILHTESDEREEVD